MDSDDLFSMLPGSSKPAPSSIAPIASSSAAHHATPKSKKKRSAPVSDEDPSERIRDVVMDDEGAPSSKRDKKDRKRKKKARLSEVEEGNGLGNGNGNVSGEVTSSQSTPKVKAAASAPIDPMEALDEEEDNMSVDDSDSTTASHVKALAQASGDQTIDDADMDLDSDSEDDANKDLEKKMPIITDEFNQESEREVVGSSGFAMVNEQETMRLKHNVEHRVALPKNVHYPYTSISTHIPHDPPAKVYKFTLDPFQRTAVNSIERNESVLVAAHTSAGKTVVAEYAIATCLRDGKRVVYTSPIKALSNQKFRELGAEFGSDRVGLMTGDTTINPDASCLVMTTEILRSMLYRGSEIMREVGWVIFDEIHYMRDKDRGVVWEETIILLPHNVRHVFLSATIPNSMQFADWIAELHDQPCHVVWTDFRPTPLQHYLFPEGAAGMSLVVDEKGVFREDNFQKAMGELQARSGEDPADPNGGKGRGGKTKKGGNKGDGSNSDIFKLVRMIMLKNLNPVIIFAFSKRECESLAMQMSKLDMNTPEQAEKVQNIFDSAMAVLTEEDQKLPQITNVIPLLKRGVGVHHGGLLPILKEVIEILFQEGLIKALFATETFSIGLNMPAKTVVFTKVTKFDGQAFRNLTGGEYIQMSGRAGRRGLDARGIVIMMCDQKIEPEAAKGMVKGQSDRLDSAFHLGYNMILNLMRVEGVSPEFMLQKCFFQFQNTMQVPLLLETQRKKEKQRRDFKLDRKDEIEEYAELKQHCEQLKEDYREVVQQPAYARPYLQVGRVVHVKYKDLDFGWGVAISTDSRHPPKRFGKGPVVVPQWKPQDSYLVYVLLKCTKGAGAKLRSDRKEPADDVGLIQPAVPGQPFEPVIVPVLGSTIFALSMVRLNMGQDLRTDQAKLRAINQLDVACRHARSPTEFLLDPVLHMGIKDAAFVNLKNQINALENKITSLPITSSPDLPRIYTAWKELDTLSSEIKAIKKQMKDIKHVLQLDELKNRKRVLRRLDFADQDDVIATKGRVACEISTGDELLLTEMIFQGVFNNLQPDQCAALLSCFVFDENSESKVQLKNELAAPLRVLQETARSIATVLNECKLPVVPDEYVQGFKIELMDCVYKWCQGASFAQICTMTDVFEGSIIRVFRRLQELIRQMAMAAKAIGNTELEEKFQESLKLLERPNTVVFNPSLYL